MQAGGAAFTTQLGCDSQPSASKPAHAMLSTCASPDSICALPSRDTYRTSQELAPQPLGI